MKKAEAPISSSADAYAIPPFRSELPAAQSGRWVHLIQAPWFPALLGVLFFLNSLGNDFAYDDALIVKRNPRIQNIADVKAIWLSDWWQPQTEEDRIINRQRDRLYRPLTMFSFALNYAVHGLNVFGFHALSIGLHALACWLVWVLTDRLFHDRALSAFAAIVFAVHPVHSEAVANLVGRAEVLAAVLLMAGLLALLPKSGEPGWGRLWLASIAFFFALMAKETAICYPLLAVIALHARRFIPDPSGPARGLNERWTMRRIATAAAFLLVPIAIYMPLRYAALEGHFIRDRSPSPYFNPIVEAFGISRLLTPIAVLGEYTRLFVVPNKLSLDYGAGIMDPVSVPTQRVLIGLASLAALAAALAGYRFVFQDTRSLKSVEGRRSPDGRTKSANTAGPPPTPPGGVAAARFDSLAWRQAAVTAAMFAASYLLISNTVLLIGVSLAERLAYWPSVPVLMLVGVVGVATYRRYVRPGQKYAAYSNGVAGVAAVFVLALGLRTVVRNMDWQSNLALFSNDVQIWPKSVTINTGLAEVSSWEANKNPALTRQARKELLERALKHLTTVMELAPRSTKAMILLGLVHEQLGNRARAIQYLSDAVQFDASNVDAYRLLNSLKQDLEQTRIAAEDLRQALTTQPANPELLAQMGEVTRALGHEQQAFEYTERAARLAPDDARIQYLYAEALLLFNEPEKAVPVLRRVVELEPANWAAHTNLAKLLASTSPADSLFHATEAHRLDSNPQTRFNLASALALNDRRDEAMALWRRIYSDLAEDSPQRQMVAEQIKILEELGR